jgi:hypothetical protein
MAAADGRELQINSLFCRPICKPDAAGQPETGEMDPTERDGTRPGRRGHYTRERLPGTPETYVVWLITQRSRVQILPPLPGKTAPGASFPGPFSATCDQSLGHVPRPIAGRFSQRRHGRFPWRGLSSGRGRRRSASSGVSKGGALVGWLAVRAGAAVASAAGSGYRPVSLGSGVGRWLPMSR